MVPYDEMTAKTSALVIIDLETNGCRNGAAVDAPYHRIVQFSALPFVAANDDPPFNAIVNPSVHIPAASTAIHGITNEVARNGIPFAEVWGQFTQYVDRHAAAHGLEPADICLCAHNMIGFDGPVLNREVLAATGHNVPYAMTDTLPAFREFFPNVTGDTPYSLPFLYNTITQKVFHTAHNALHDCNALRELLLHCPNVARGMRVFSAEECRRGFLVACGDDEPLTAVKYVGPKRATAIADFLRREQWRDKTSKTVGGLRAYFGGGANGTLDTKKLEAFLRTDINVFSDAQLNCIMKQVTGGQWMVHTHATMPYYRFRHLNLHVEGESALWAAKLCSVDALRDMYMYECAENKPQFCEALQNRCPSLSTASVTQIAREVC